MKVIGFGHKKGVGKDSIARFLSTEYRLRYKGKCVIRKGFADSLKDISYQLFNWTGLKPREYYENNPSCKNDHLDAIDMSVRELYIAVGMRMRVVYKNVWIDHLLQGVSADLLIITDVRFYNEVEAIRNRGGLIIKIDRPDLPVTSDQADDALNDFDEWDHIIINDGSLGKLHEEAVNIIESFLTD